MTLQEIKDQLTAIQANIERLQEDARTLDNKSVADYLDCELGYISYRLGELESMEIDSEGNPDVDGLEEGLDDWWADLDNRNKSEISNIPYPTYDDGGRGDNEWEFRERTDKWWKAQTIANRQQIYKDNTAWWDKE